MSLHIDKFAWHKLMICCTGENLSMCKLVLSRKSGIFFGNFTVIYAEPSSWANLIKHFTIVIYKYLPKLRTQSRNLRS